MRNKRVYYYYYKFDEEFIGVNEVNYMTAVESVVTEVGLRWLKTVSSTFQDVDFGGSKLALFIN